MIDILYSVGDTVWRESAIKIFSMNISQVEDGKTVKLAGLAVVKEDKNVIVFHNANMNLEECNELIISGIGEIDLRGFSIFGTHTLEEFNQMQAHTRKNTVNMKISNDSVSVTPPNQTIREDKDARNAERRAKRAAAKKAKAENEE